MDLLWEGDKERHRRLLPTSAARPVAKKTSPSSAGETKYAKGSSSIFSVMYSDMGFRSGGHECRFRRERMSFLNAAGRNNRQK